MRIIAAFLGVGFLAACATGPATGPTEVASAAVGEKKICKSMPVMGSNFPKRVCSTAEEWEQFDKENYKSVEDFERDRKSGITQGAFEN